MDVEYTDTAKWQLKKLEHDVQERIVEKMRFFRNQSDPLYFAKHLAGHNAYRFRVGDYRVTFDLKNNIARVLSIRRRDEAYR